MSKNYIFDRHNISFPILPEEFCPLQILLASPIRKTHDDIWLIDGFYVELCDPEVIIAGHEKWVKWEKCVVPLFDSTFGSQDIDLDFVVKMHLLYS